MCYMHTVGNECSRVTTAGGNIRGGRWLIQRSLRAVRRPRSAGACESWAHGKHERAHGSVYGCRVAPGHVYLSVSDPDRPPTPVNSLFFEVEPISRGPCPRRPCFASKTATRRLESFEKREFDRGEPEESFLPDENVPFGVHRLETEQTTVGGCRVCSSKGRRETGSRLPWHCTKRREKQTIRRRRKTGEGRAGLCQ